MPAAAAVTWSPEHLLNPYPFYAALREAGPVLQVEPFQGAYTVTRHADVTAVLKNPTLFSSQRLTPQVSLPAEAGERARAFFRNTRNLLSSDPPEHTRLRALVGRAFTARRIAELEPWMRARTRELLAPMLARAEFDLMKELAIPLPVLVISELLGVEPERREDFKRWSDHSIQAMAMTMGALDPTPLLASLREFYTYLEGALEQRRHTPREDLLSALVASSEGFLQVADLISFTQLLLVAGNETTTHLLGNALVALLHHPEQLQRLLEEPSRSAAVMEEALRYDGPAQMLMRVATQDTRIAGQPLPAGARVMLLLASANRDPRRFADPDRFDPLRENTGSLALGAGIHFCLGAALARLEARVVMEEFAARVRHVAFAPRMGAVGEREPGRDGYGDRSRTG